MYKNVLGNYTINITPKQARTVLNVLQNVDIYVMTTGEYLEHAILVSKIEEIVEDSKVEQFKCPSYFDDNRILKDCLCGRCK